MANEQQQQSKRGAYRVTHGSLTMGYTATGEKNTIEQGQTVELPVDDAAKMLQLGVIEKA